MTLTEVSYYSRRFAPFALLFFLLFLIFYYLIKIVFITLSPSKQQSIYLDPIFNKINRPIINDVSDSSNLNFTIDTIEGKPITATQSAKVYFLPAAATRFGYREKIYLIANSLGFDTEVVSHTLEGKQAEFRDAKQSLQVDITNFNFTYEYNFEEDPAIFQDTIWPQTKESAEAATDFLKEIDQYPEELAQGRTNSIFIQYRPEEKQMKILESNQDANLVEVDYYRPDLEQYPIVSTTYFNSQNYVMLVFYNNDYKVVKAQVKYYEKSDSQLGIYPVKTGDAAWESLTAGSGLVIRNEGEGQDVVIKKIFMGYLDPDIYQEYLQPVYVFLGDNNFVAYVPAVTEEYFSE
ncbi:hypothetical protein A2774_00340 [Candidatus Roizmanbacteria bacterium RIFCSPHIGHO2_01_FULL_39_12c]|uniref:Uncharacterized protein n=1 Tax=Candidatus Roizmanbacteria bacterium RIFCSPHIGHO2_01_FULL_39_12c TaxID=1802031 RepID=A0A1F7GD98_9BACT|nr:MAG: hypothetical protein A2774_00340 [Candidatus Roizmanbacteria bacterium RIFCSPHIGHO2_01_FULL_39_12c]